MGGSRMTNVLVAHIGGRVRSIASRPSAVATLLLCAMISAFFWPSLTPAGTAPWGLDLGTPGPQRQIEADQMAVVALAVIGVLWIGFFPLLLGMIVRPQATGTGRGRAIELGHPALPLSTRARVVLEALTILLLIMLARVPFILLRNQLSGGADLYPENIAGSFVPGALVLTPALFLVLGRSKSLEYMFLGATVTGVLICAAMPLGLLVAPLSLTMTLLPIIALALWVSGLEPSRGRFSLDFWQSKRLSRRAIDPERRLRLDFVERALAMFVPFALAQVVIMVLYSQSLFGGISYYLGSTVVFSLLIGFLVLRPMGSAQAIAGVWGKAGYEPGDFLRAFSVLPVRRELVLRTVWLHGFVTGCILRIATLLAAAFNTKIALGEALFFTDSEGHLVAEIILPLLAMIPCAAGFLVEGSAGDRRMAFFSGALFVLSPHIMFISLIGGAEPTFSVVLMVSVALLGGLPCFRHFRPATAVV